MKTENLWNLDKGKTKKVIAYISTLEPHATWNAEEVKYFEKRIRQALDQKSANAMLIHIGYIWKQRPVLYSYIDEWGNFDGKKK